MKSYRGKISIIIESPFFEKENLVESFKYQSLSSLIGEKYWRTGDSRRNATMKSDFPDACFLSSVRRKGQRTVVCSPVEHTWRVMCARRKWSPWSMGTTGTLEVHKHTQKWKCQDWQESCRPSSPETRLAACGFALPLFVSPSLSSRGLLPLPSRLPPSLFQILPRTYRTTTVVSNPPWLRRDETCQWCLPRCRCTTTGCP